MAAMLAALTAVATLAIRIPTLGTNGYINTGDAVVLLSAWLLGNPYGALAAGLGSAIADLLAGYPVYIPGTAVIKFLMALAAAAVFNTISRINMPKTAYYIISSVAAETIMVLGYFMYESAILGYGAAAAAASLGSNVIQGVTCIVLGNALIHVLSRAGVRFYT